jgi:hypothetical protein
VGGPVWPGDEELGGIDLDVRRVLGGYVFVGDDSQGSVPWQAVYDIPGVDDVGLGRRVVVMVGPPSPPRLVVQGPNPGQVV